MNLKGRDLLTLKDYTKEEIKYLIDKAIEIKRNPKKFSKSLEGKTLAMIFQKTSTRTRVSFEVAMTQMGGHAIYLDWRTTQFPIADIRDEARCIARYSDAIMARMLKHADLKLLADAAEVPVINGCCEKYHPCQILGDLLTIKEKKGKLEGLKLVYMGIANNISNSLTVGCTKVGMNFVLCSPERHPPSFDEEIIKEAKKTGLYFEEKDPRKAIKDADIIYTDTWIDMELFLDPKFKKEKERRIKTFAPYQVNKKLLELNPNVLVMHPLPAHRGLEIDDYTIESKNSIIFDQAENRLHIQKAILLELIKD
ncbi:MAG: ornithine carbamoyltransferase [Candidatus Aenigmatarchaeota archaeon]